MGIRVHVSFSKKRPVILSLQMIGDSTFLGGILGFVVQSQVSNFSESFVCICVRDTKRKTDSACMRVRMWQVWLYVWANSVSSPSCMCAWLCFIKLILGNRYVRSWGFTVSEPREKHHRFEIAASQPHPVPPQIIWGVQILTLHLNYVAVYTSPLSDSSIPCLQKTRQMRGDTPETQEYM